MLAARPAQRGHPMSGPKGPSRPGQARQRSIASRPGVQREVSVTERSRMTLPALMDKKRQGVPITWLTCYDYPTAYLQEQAGIDMILV